MMFADVAKGVENDALAESISTIAAVFSFLRTKSARMQFFGLAVLIRYLYICIVSIPKSD